MLRLISFVIVALVLVRPGMSQCEDTYRDLLEALSSPICFSSDAANKCHDDSMVMVRLEIARQRLLTMSQLPSDLTDIRESASVDLAECYRSLQRQRTLDGAIPDIESLATSTLDATPALYKLANQNTESLTRDENEALADLAVRVSMEVIQGLANAYEASEERTGYRKTFRQMRSATRDKFRSVVSSRYQNSRETEKMIEVDLQGSFGAYRTADWLTMKNVSGQDLHDCTLFVDLHGWHGDESEYLNRGDSHVHFVRHWPADATIIAPYPSTSVAGVASDQSIDFIDKLDVFALSRDLQQHVQYQYVGENYDSDLRAHLESVAPQFQGTWYRYDTNFFINDGFYCYFSGNQAIPASQVSMRLPEGFKDFTWQLSDRRFGVGSENAQNFRDESFNSAGVPQFIELEFHFPHSEFKHTVRWDEVAVGK